MLTVSDESGVSRSVTNTELKKKNSPPLNAKKKSEILKILFTVIIFVNIHRCKNLTITQIFSD